MTTKRRRRFTADFKKRVALEALRGDRTVQAIAAKHEVHPNQVGTWKRQAIVEDGRRCRRVDDNPSVRQALRNGSCLFCSQVDRADRYTVFGPRQSAGGKYLRTDTTARAPFLDYSGAQPRPVRRRSALDRDDDGITHAALECARSRPAE